MGDPKGFMTIERKDPGYRAVDQRVTDYKEVEVNLSDKEIQEQAARCMDCGVPFCHGSGCPLENVIPEWNDLTYNGYWEEALTILRSTNNFPEFTGRICPAPCETSCTFGATDDNPVTIRQIEKTLAEKGYSEGFTSTPSIPEVRTGKRVAVIGSGPAGLTVADQLNQLGHLVTVYERDKFVGGFLRYGIPDFKLDKDIVQRRIDLMIEEGITFETEVEVGVDILASYLTKKFDAVCITIGARQARDLPIAGREAKNVHFAMEFLGQSNRRVSGETFSEKEILVKDAKVLVIGGGDTGSDCVGTSNRQGAAKITQIEIMPKPPMARADSTPWPQWPSKLRTSSSHLEGCDRQWNIMSKNIETDAAGNVTKVNAVEVKWVPSETGGRPTPVEVAGSEFVIEADYVFLAMGFTGPETGGIAQQFELDLDVRSNIQTNKIGMTSTEGVFAAGDAHSGASLVVRAIASGRQVADGIHSYLS